MSFSLRQIFQADQRPQYSEVKKVMAWNKARVIPGLPKEQFRMDPCGAVIEWGRYGDKTPNGRGWEVDYIEPTAVRMLNHGSGLRAIHWQNNQVKGDSLTTNRPVDARVMRAGV